MSTEHNLPQCTVVIPNHNYQQWLEDAMSSVANQDYPNKEMVIVDDGSTDSSWEWLRNRELFTVGRLGLPKGATDFLCFDFKGVKTRAFRLDKAYGPSYARNIGIKDAMPDTHIFGFLDADDFWLQGKMSKSMAKFLEAPEEIGVVYTDNFGLNIHNNVITREYRHSYDQLSLKQNNYIHSGSFVSRLAFQAVGLYDEEMRTAEDWALWLKISSKFMIEHIPEALVVARHGNYNSTNTVPMSVWKQNWERIGKMVKGEL